MSDSSPEAPEGLRSKRYFDIHPPVFWPAAILTVLCIAVTLIVGEPMKAVFSAVQQFISDTFGWFLVISVNLYLFTILFIAFSKYGDIRLGGRTAVPEFSRLS